MDPAHRIRAAVRQVEELRQGTEQEPGLDSSIMSIKRLQSRRFACTYADLLSGGKHAAPAQFFLDELYSDRDYAQRDSQFARIAGAIQQFFPRPVVATAVALAELHGLTESLDYEMGRAWHSAQSLDVEESAMYVAAWRAVGRMTEREKQLSTALRIGEEMARLTRTPGLRLMLKMMRAPAAAAGLSSLQRFLEAGFDTFSSMARQRNGVEEFLRIIELRESALIDLLFNSEVATCVEKLRQNLFVGVTCPS